MEENKRVVNADLLPEVGLFHRDMLKDAHEMIKGGIDETHNKAKTSVKTVLDELLLKKGDYDNMMWIAPPFVGVSYKRKGKEFIVSLEVLGNNICSTIIGETSLGETLTCDIFIAKAKIYVGYDANKANLIYKGTACYRKMPTLSWRCVTTGEKVLYSLG